MTSLPVSAIVLSAGLALILIGLWGMLSRKNIIRIIIGFSLVDTGIHMLLVSIGYVTGRSAPIIDDTLTAAQAGARVVDPVPSAIVIGLGVTAVMLSFAIRIYKTKKTLSIDACTESKW